MDVCIIWLPPFVDNGYINNGRFLSECIHLDTSPTTLIATKGGHVNTLFRKKSFLRRCVYCMINHFQDAEAAEFMLTIVDDPSFLSGLIGQGRAAVYSRKCFHMLFMQCVHERV